MRESLAGRSGSSEGRQGTATDKKTLALADSPGIEGPKELSSSLSYSDPWPKSLRRMSRIALRETVVNRAYTTRRTIHSLAGFVSFSSASIVTSTGAPSFIRTFLPSSLSSAFSMRIS